MKLALPLLLVVLAFAQGCGQTDQTELREFLKIRVQNDYVAPYRQGDLDRWLEVFSIDVVALHDGLPPLEGKPAIRGFAETVAANFLIEKMTVTVDEVRLGDSWAWTRGKYDATFVAKTETAPPGVAGSRQGKFLLVWERQSDGEWRVILDMGNDSPAQPNAE